MAAYLRTVVRRASERVAPTLIAVDPTRTDNQQQQQDDEQPREGGCEHLKGDESTREESDGAAIAMGSGCETASSTGTLDELVETHEDDESAFCVHIEQSREAHRDGEVVATRDHRKAPWAYCDVLLQPDECGLGLNLCVSRVPRGLQSMHDGAPTTTTTVVVVSSFRRLHCDDIGPAEACGQIQAGDVLWSIEGERTPTLETVASSLSQQTSESILLRFLRPTNATCDWTPIDQAAPIATAPSVCPKSGELGPDVALLIRELVTRNQSLEEQLLASRLKQDEQRIQLDQLHALYAKTQLENITHAKPFTRRGSSVSSATGTLSLAAARLMGTSAMQYDVAFAVDAERERLTRQFDQQLAAQKWDLQKACDAQLEAVRAAADKKIRMLEHGIRQLLTSSTPCESGAAPVEVSPYVLALRHRVLHEQREDSDKSRNDCVLCLLEHGWSQQPDKDHDGWQNQVVGILDEYAALRATREELLRGEVVPCGEPQGDGGNETVATEIHNDC
jgi:hypothetical protein